MTESLFRLLKPCDTQSTSTRGYSTELSEQFQCCEISMEDDRQGQNHNVAISARTGLRWSWNFSTLSVDLDVVSSVSSACCSSHLSAHSFDLHSAPLDRSYWSHFEQYEMAFCLVYVIFWVRIRDRKDISLCLRRSDDLQHTGRWHTYSLSPVSLSLPYDVWRCYWEPLQRTKLKERKAPACTVMTSWWSSMAWKIAAIVWSFSDLRHRIQIQVALTKIVQGPQWC